MNSVVNSVHDTDIKGFEDVFSTILGNIHDFYKEDGELDDAKHWFQKVAEYNVPHGKKNRGMMVVKAYRYLIDKNMLTPENLTKSQILGWCVELLQAFFLIDDDIMDASLTRRGRQCWYKVHGVGMVAVNDALFLQSLLFTLLRKYFGTDPCYIQLVDLFHEVCMGTVMGQCLDLRTATFDSAVDLTKFTLDRYTAIVKWKTAFYSFYLPVALAMHMAGIADSVNLSNAKVILLHMGAFFQIQDDYLDCYGTPEITGKIGTDIQDNKCSWLIVQALRLVNSEQRSILEENYGQDDPVKIARVKAVYDEVELPRVYRELEEESYKELLTLIDRHAGDLPRAVFTDYANKIYKRQR